MKNFAWTLACAGALTGCSGPIVTQTTAFVNAGSTITKTVETAQQNNLSQENALRQAMLAANYVVKERRDKDGAIRYFDAGDGQCRIEGKIYLRYVYTSERPAETFIKGKDTLDLLKQGSALQPDIASGCAALAHCEEHEMAEGCNTACYGKQERTCIDAISSMVARNKDPARAAALRPIALTLSIHSYPLQMPIESRASLEVLAAFTNYLHILQAAATPEPSALDRALGKVGGDPAKSLADNASTLAKNVAAMRTKYNSAASKAPFLPKIGGVSDTNLTKQLGAIGQLLSILDEISKTETSARKIEDILAENVDAKGNKVSGPGTQQRYLYIDQYIREIGDALATQLDQTVVTQDLAMRSIRHIYGVRFEQANSMVTRLESIRALDDYPVVTFQDYAAEQDNVREQIPKTVKALTDAHDRLAEMIFQPTAEDRKKAFLSGVENLKDVVQGLAGAVSAFK